jgi:NAD+ kinase
MSRPRVIVVAKRSALARFQGGEGDTRAQKLLDTGHETVKKWLPAHEQHVRVVDQVVEALEKAGVETLLLHGAQAEFDPLGAHLIVTVGGDGTLLAASHNVSNVPILGVNSAPRYSVGFFCAARGREAVRTLRKALEGEVPSVRLNRMAVRINGQLRSERVLNEALYCHAEPAATSNYIVQAGGRREEQRSSGFWVGPAAGSTAAMRSAGGRILPLTSKKLQMVVREPYLGHGRKLSLVRCVVGERAKIIAWSKMERVRIFLDGPYRMIRGRLGDEVSFEASEQPLTVIGLVKDRSR